MSNSNPPATIDYNLRCFRRPRQPGCSCFFCYNLRLAEKLTAKFGDRKATISELVAMAKAFQNKEDLPFTTEQFMVEVDQGRKDFRGESFEEISFSALNQEVLSGFDFSSTYWDLSRLSNQQFESCLFDGAVFRQCWLEETTFRWCVLDFVQFEDCLLREFKTDKALMRAARFDSLEVHSAEFKMTDVSRTDFSQVERRRITLIDAISTRGTIWPPVPPRTSNTLPFSAPRSPTPLVSSW